MAVTRREQPFTVGRRQVMPVYLLPQEHAAVVQAAKQAGMDNSEFLRELALSYIEQQAQGETQ